MLALAMLVKRFEAIHEECSEANTASDQEWRGVRGPLAWEHTALPEEQIPRIPDWVIQDGFVNSAVLPLLAHQQKTLRDTAVQLVASTAARCPPSFTANMLDTMLSTIKPNAGILLPPAHAEGCLSLLVLLVRRQGLPLPSLEQSLWVQLADVLSSYVGHSASTVRQAASKLALQLAMAPCRSPHQPSSRRHRATFVLHVLRTLSDTWDTQVLPALVPGTSGTSLLQSSAAFGSEAAWQVREGIMFCYEMIVHYLLQDHARLLSPISAHEGAEDSEVDGPSQPPTSTADGQVSGGGEPPAPSADNDSPESSPFDGSTDSLTTLIPPATVQAFPFGLQGVSSWRSSAAASPPGGPQTSGDLPPGASSSMVTPVKAVAHTQRLESTPRPALLTDERGAPCTPCVAPSPWASVTPHVSSVHARSNSGAGDLGATPERTGPSSHWAVRRLPASQGVAWPHSALQVPVPVCVLTVLSPQPIFQRLLQEMLFHTQLCVECPKFELRRMGGQLLPALADMCLWAAPDALLRLAAELGLAIPLRASQAVLMVGRVFNCVLRRSQRLIQSVADSALATEARLPTAYAAAVLSRLQALLTSDAVQLSLQGMAVRAPSDKCLVLALDTLALALRQGAVPVASPRHAVRPVVASLLERCSKVLRLAGAFAHASAASSLSPAGAATSQTQQATAGLLHAALALCDELALESRSSTAEDKVGAASSVTAAPAPLTSQRSVGFSDGAERWATRGQWRRASRQPMVVQSLQHAFSRRLLPQWHEAWLSGQHVEWLHALQRTVEAAGGAWAPATVCEQFRDQGSSSAEDFWRSLVQPVPAGLAAEVEEASGLTTPPEHASDVSGVSTGSSGGSNQPCTAVLMDCVAVLGRPPSVAEQLRSPEPAAATPAAPGGTPVSGAQSVLSGTTSESSSTVPRGTPTGGAGVSPSRESTGTPDALSPGGIGMYGSAPVTLPTSPGFALGVGMHSSRPGSAGAGELVTPAADGAAARQQQAGVLLHSCVRALVPDIVVMLQQACAAEGSRGAQVNCCEAALLCVVCACWAGRLQSTGGAAEAWEALLYGMQRLQADVPDAGVQEAAQPVVWLPHWTHNSFLVAYLGALAAPHTPAAWAHCCDGESAAPLQAPQLEHLLAWDAACATVAAAVATLAPELHVSTPAWACEAGSLPCSMWGTAGLSIRRKDAALLPQVMRTACAALCLMASLPLQGATRGAGAAWAALCAAVLHRGGDGTAAPSVSLDSQWAADTADVGRGEGVAPPAAGEFGADALPPSLQARGGGSTWSSPGGGPAGVANGGVDPVHWRGQTEELPSFRQSRRHLVATLQPIEAGGSDMEPVRAGSASGDGFTPAGEGDTPSGAGQACSGTPAEGGGDTEGGDDWDDWDEESSSSDEGTAFVDAIGAAADVGDGDEAFVRPQSSFGSLSSPSGGGGVHAEGMRFAAAALLQVARDAGLGVGVPMELVSMAS